MKAIRLRRFGGPEELRLDEVETPQPGEGEVLIEVHAAGLNYTDLLLREGRLPGAPPPPFTPGFEAAGVVAAVGAGVTRVRVGDRVAAMLPNQGAFAEGVCAATSALTALPDSVGFEAAVALLTQGSTALLSLQLAARLQPGDAVLVPSAAGGVGTLLVQLAKRLGAGQVIAAASTEEKRALAIRLGADSVVDPAQPDWPERVRSATGGRGADVVFERDGGAAFSRSLRALAPGGRLVVFGVESIFSAQLSTAQLGQLVFQNQALVGFASVSLAPAVQAAAIGAVFERTARGELEVVVGQTFALGAIADAHLALAERRTTGKVVVLPSAGAP